MNVLRHWIKENNERIGVGVVFFFLLVIVPLSLEFMGDLVEYLVMNKWLRVLIFLASLIVLIGVHVVCLFTVVYALSRVGDSEHLD